MHTRERWNGEYVHFSLTPYKISYTIDIHVVYLLIQYSLTQFFSHSYLIITDYNAWLAQMFMFTELLLKVNDSGHIFLSSTWLSKGAPINCGMTTGIIMEWKLTTELPSSILPWCLYILPVIVSFLHILISTHIPNMYAFFKLIGFCKIVPGVLDRTSERVIADRRGPGWL